MAVVRHIVVFVLCVFAVARGGEPKETGGIERRFEELERRLNDHETVIGDLQKTDAAQQATIKNLKATIQDQQATIQNQQAAIQNLKATIQGQQATIHNQQAAIRRQQAAIKGQQATIEGQNRLIEQIQSELRTGKELTKKHSMLLQVIQRDVRNINQMYEERMDTGGAGKTAAAKMGFDNRTRQAKTGPGVKSLTRRQERSRIAFSAYLDHDIDTSDHQTVKFNKIITNEGNGYSVYTGVFTCPEAGMYLFIFTIGQRGLNGPTGVITRLNVNSANKVDAYVDSFHASQNLQGGNNVLLRLKVGDAVWVDTFGGHVEGSSGVRVTTFSGVYLYP